MTAGERRIKTDPAPGRPRPLRMLWMTAVWGACFVAIQWGLRDAPLLWYAALRALAAGGALLALAGVQHRPQPVGRRAWALLTGLGVINVTVAFAAMFGGVAGLATGTAAVLANAQPLLILLPAWWLYGERVAARTAIALVIGFAGLVVVALPGGGGSGAGLSLLAAAAITGGTLLSRRLQGMDLIVATAWHLLIGGAALAVFAAITEGPPAINWTPRFILSLAFLSLIGTAATTVAWFTEARRSRLDALSTWTFLTPVFGIGIAAVVLGERPGGWTAIGLTAVLLAMLVALTPHRRSRVPASATAAGLDRDSESVAERPTKEGRSRHVRRPHRTLTRR
ncbi:MAG TPA: DMT family transporter [Propionicimonas sp.]